MSLRYAEEGDRLPGRLFFHENGVEKEITGDSQVIYRHSPEGGEEEAVFSKTWDGVEGAFCLEIYPEDVHGYAMDEEIAATLVWEIGYEVE